MENSPSLKEVNKVDRVPVPVYDPNDQIHVAPSDKPEHYRTASMDAIDKERRRAALEIAKKTGLNLLSWGGIGFDWALDHIDPAIGRHFQTHGFKENRAVIPSVDKIITEGIQPDRVLNSMPFIKAKEEGWGLGAFEPYQEGGIYLIADYDKELTQKDGGIKYVGVGDAFVRVVDEMQKQWPQVQIVPWHDLPKILTERANERAGQKMPYQTLSDENRPYYKNYKDDPFGNMEQSDRPTDRIQVFNEEKEPDPNEVF